MRTLAVAALACLVVVALAGCASAPQQSTGSAAPNPSTIIVVSDPSCHAANGTTNGTATNASSTTNRTC